MNKVILYNTQDKLPITHSSLKRVVVFLTDLLGIVTGEVIFHLVSKEVIADLHSVYFNDPSPTDCITFPIDPNGSVDGILGEVFICPQVALEYAHEQNEDPYREVTLYLIHGLLHLLGYDDVDEPSQQEMRSKENLCLDYLTKKNVFISR